MFSAAYTTAAKRLAQQHTIEKGNAATLRQSVGRAAGDPRADGSCSSLLHPKTKRPAILIGRGPASQSVAFVACVSRAVSPTALTQPRDGKKICPDTAILQIMARPTFLHQEERVDGKLQAH
jgi:hypothetical protein